MKKIEALIRPEKFPAVKESLEKAGLIGLTAYEVKGRGRQKGITLSYRTSEYTVDMLEKMKIELVVNDQDVDKAIDSIVTASRTGKIGDGKIFISPVEDVIRIRTQDRGRDAV